MIDDGQAGNLIQLGQALIWKDHSKWWGNSRILEYPQEWFTSNQVDFEILEVFI